MGSRFPSTKAIQLLDRRGPKELAKALKRCWFEECVHEDSPYINMAVATVRIHATLDEYEHLRNLPATDRDKLLDLLKEVYSSDSLDVVSMDFELETNDQTNEQIKTLSLGHNFFVAISG